MSNISSCSLLTTMFQTSNVACQSVNLTDDLKIGLEYDIHGGLLNIFVKNTGNNMRFPSQINILSNSNENSQFISNYPVQSSELQQDFQEKIIDFSYGEEDEPKICIELSYIYVYDLDDENENNLSQTMITSSPLLFSSSSSSSSSSCFDDHTIDNDDGYSTHSLDDIEQQHSLSIPPSKYIIPFVPYQHHYYYSSSAEEFVSSIHRLIAQVMWLSPFKKTVKQMMIDHLFD